mmetsp:Transcript_168081/g.539768  ORF Transcript_168081/g.539768 Transcript_168081/m.539768 type:complete len:444 (-) Transcript_168081:56-1387(-)
MRVAEAPLPAMPSKSPSLWLQQQLQPQPPTPGEIRWRHQLQLVPQLLPSARFPCGGGGASGLLQNGSAGAPAAPSAAAVPLPVFFASAAASSAQPPLLLASSSAGSGPPSRAASAADSSAGGAEADTMGAEELGGSRYDPEGTPENRALGELVIQLILQECGFLRIREYTLQAVRRSHWVPMAPGEERQRNRVEAGTCMFLRIFVEGLPALKRSKWHMPLCWAVSKILQKADCNAFLRCRELYVPTDKTNSTFVKVDFLAARESSNDHSLSQQGAWTPAPDPASEAAGAARSGGSLAMGWEARVGALASEAGGGGEEESDQHRTCQTWMDFPVLDFGFRGREEQPQAWGSQRAPHSTETLAAAPHAPAPRAPPPQAPAPLAALAPHCGGYVAVQALGRPRPLPGVGADGGSSAGDDGGSDQGGEGGASVRGDGDDEDYEILRF